LLHIWRARRKNATASEEGKVSVPEALKYRR